MMKITKFKWSSQIWQNGDSIIKLNLNINQIRRRRGRTNGKRNYCEIKKLSFQNYGNLLQVLIHSPSESTNEIIKWDVRNQRGKKIMIFTPTILIIRYYGNSKHFAHGSGFLSFISPKELKQEKS